MVMSMFRINVARSDSFITACPVAKRHHFSWGIACRGRQPSIPWAQQRVFAVRTPVLQNSCIWRKKSRKKVNSNHLEYHFQAQTTFVCKITQSNWVIKNLPILFHQISKDHKPLRNWRVLFFLCLRYRSTTLSHSLASCLVKLRSHCSEINKTTQPFRNSPGNNLILGLR